MNVYAKKILLALALVMPLTHLHAGSETAQDKKEENEKVGFLEKYGVQIGASLGVLAVFVFCYKFFKLREKMEDKWSSLFTKEKPLYEQLSNDAKQEYVHCKNGKQNLEDCVHLQEESANIIKTKFLKEKKRDIMKLLPPEAQGEFKQILDVLSEDGATFYNVGRYAYPMFNDIFYGEKSNQMYTEYADSFYIKAGLKKAEKADNKKTKN